MIKQCKVKMNNGVNMVIDFDGRDIQMPSVKTKENIIYVKNEKGKFTVVDKAEYEKSLVPMSKPVSTKTKKEVITAKNEE